jgi:hypothetical protein
MSALSYDRHWLTSSALHRATASGIDGVRRLLIIPAAMLRNRQRWRATQPA